MTDLRLPAGPAERIDRAASISFSFDGATRKGLAGDTIASALSAAGVRVLTRSFKYHRPRAVLCCAGRCPNCLVQVDGIPNVRACMEPLREGQVVRHQNAWPSLAFDILSILDRFDRFLPVGFYYKVFHRPRVLWPLFASVLRKAAGLGRIDTKASPDLHAATRHLHRDVAVIGGGPAGCLAALEAAGAGASVLLIDDQPELGGHLRARALPAVGDPRIAGLAGYAAAARLRDLVLAEKGIEVLSDATVFGLYEGTLVGVVQRGTLCRVRARAIVVATGSQERPALFANNDLPGIMLGSAALRLTRLQGVRVGTQAAVIVDDDHGWLVAEELRLSGVPLVAVVDLRRGASQGNALAASLAASGVRILSGATLLSASGSGLVASILVSVSGAQERIACDLVAMSLRPEPVTALIAQDGGTRRYDPRIGEFVPGTLSEAVLAAGEVEGVQGTAFACAAGVAAGREAALRLGHGGDGAVQGPRADRERQRAAALATPDQRPAIDPHGHGKRFVCLCEDVGAKDIVQGIAEGFDSLEILKRYSTVTMGPCQGKMCHVTSARLRSSLTGETMEQTGLTTARPPFQPVTLAALAGPHQAPVRRTAMHDQHQALGASWLDMGDWKRPFIYTSVAQECRAVREAAGIIDVSTLGKLMVSGSGAADFLDWLHPNRFSDLKVGRVRYRAMCDDAGIVFDDGTVARLGADRFFLTTGTGSLDAVEQWLGWWLAASPRDVAVTNVTSNYAAINLAGPRSREVLARLTDLDVSKEAMPYLAAAEGEIAGVHAVILRIGFVGELSYEIHVPADHGAHLWNALMTAGREFGIAPFGVEAQRVLRLEKQHVIVGQDTDALTGPLEAGLGWLVKADKADFIGRSAIAAVAARGVREALVGFEIAEHTVPDEGASVLRDGRLAGRVTSAKWSDTLKKTIGMAIVPLESANEGAEIRIRRVGQADLVARVALKPFYDPTGARLRS